MANSAKRIFKIHPAIGIARVGNAPADTFFIGPEIPGEPVTGAHRIGTRVPPFKGDSAKSLIKPQAVRFRIYEYTRNASGKWEASREVNLASKDVRSIEWKVHLANCKASFNEFWGLSGKTKPPAEKRNRWVKSGRSAYLDIDFGARTIAGKSKAGIEFRHDRKKTKGQKGPTFRDDHPKAGQPVIDYLGELRTDPSGRLIVIGGKGHADTVVSPMDPDVGFITDLLDSINNHTWFDDVSDGPVTARLSIEIDGRLETPMVAGAWVIVGPPDFAPDLLEVVTLYDRLYDMAVWDLPLPSDEALFDAELAPLRDLNQELRVKKYKGLKDYSVSFAAEIEPVLRRMRGLGATNQTIRDNHASIGGSGNTNMRDTLANPGGLGSSARKNLFERLRPPPDLPRGFASAKSGPRDMPRMFGEDYPKDSLTVTRTMYALFQRWNAGGFVEGTAAAPAGITPHGLDRAALEHALGAALHPGIEVGWLIADARLYAEPFRIDHKASSPYWGEGWRKVGPGFFTRQLALPWHSDFYSCTGLHYEEHYKTYNAWWPGQRPDEVKPKGSKDGKAVDWFRSSTGAWDIRRELEDEIDIEIDDGDAELYRMKMLDHWSKLGFVVEVNGDFVEDERSSEDFS